MLGSGAALSAYHVAAMSDSGAISPGKLSDDRRLTAMGLAVLGGGCIFILVPVLLVVVAVVTRGNRNVSDSFFGAAVVSAGIVFVLWIGVYFGFRFMFFHDAVRVAGAPPRSEIPRVTAAPEVITGDAEWAIRLATRGTMGKVGKCWIELYANGLQIWKGPDHAEPRWQFSYQNLLQAESVDIVSSTKSGEVHQYFVRLIVDRPRMAFLFGSHWLRNKNAPALADKLRQHNVPTVSEEFDD